MPNNHFYNGERKHVLALQQYRTIRLAAHGPNLGSEDLVTGLQISYKILKTSIRNKFF